MKRFYAYIRVSTVKQGEHGISLQEQRSAIETYAQRHDLGIVEWFEEMETAAKRGRPMFSKMLAQLRRGQVDGVIIHKIDRSARNLKDWSDIGELIDQGIDVRFAHESLDMQSRGGRLTADIQAVIAADYVRNLRDEVRKGYYGRLKQGFYPLAAPLGYVDQGKAKAKTPHPVKAPLVRQAFELYAAGTVSLKDLKSEMYVRGLRNKQNGMVTIEGLSGMLRNPFYIGVIRIRKTGEVFQGVHEPIIDRALFDRVQATLDGRLNGKVQKHEFTFRRLIRCSECGHVLSGERQKGHAYYRCHHCPGVSLREPDVADEMHKIMAKIALANEEIEDFGDLVDDLRSRWTNGARERISMLKIALGATEDRLNKLTDALLDGLIESEIYQQRKLTLLKDRNELREKIASASSENSVPDKVVKFFELAKRPCLGYEIANSKEKRELVETISSNLVARGKNVEVALLSPYREVLEWRETMRCGHRPDRLRTSLRKLLDILLRSA
ncbi:recombinase family protein [Parvibaculum sp.]|uniref:recombinase family protein n=1 Tax=Parvibaculum sp. TaxID=2024848 RepID=UPI0026070E9D|nr:recombinase family protein [Parvibaculum sp.]MCW5726233.1 recombinase family protein [Parvibaculum sp.]